MSSRSQRLSTYSQFLNMALHKQPMQAYNASVKKISRAMICSHLLDRRAISVGSVPTAQVNASEISCLWWYPKYGRMQTNVSLLFFLWFATDFNLIRALCLQYRLSWVLGLLYGATSVAIGNFMMTLEEGLIRPASSHTCQHCTCSWEHHLACLTLTNLTWRIPPNSTKKVTEIVVF